MGLDTTHDCWHGAYSAFNRWRMKLAEVAGIPLPLMEGFYLAGPDEQAIIRNALDWAKAREGGPLCGDYRGPVLVRHIEDQAPYLPIKWESLKRDPLHVLLDHSDCDGNIPVRQLRRLADRLEELLPLLPDEDAGGHIGIWKDKTQKFITGLRLAHSRRERVGFH